MKHYTEASWADFARKQISAETRRMMQQHIDDGCKRCKKTLAIWQAVTVIAEKEITFTPPPDTVRIAKTQFAAVIPQQPSGIRLVFDSMLQPVTAGLRGSIAARQLLYETDHYYIDLRLEPKSAEERACLVGQVLNRGGQKREAQGLSVRLQDGKLPIAQTLTNHFGEFQFEFLVSGGLCIAISRDQENEILLPLYGVKPAETKGLD